MMCMPTYCSEFDKQVGLRSRYVDGFSTPASLELPLVTPLLLPLACCKWTNRRKKCFQYALHKFYQKRNLNLFLLIWIENRAIERSNCFHKNGHDSPCRMSSNPYMIMFGVVEILFSQIPDFDQIWWLSIVAAVMSFTYSSIGLILGIMQVACKPNAPSLSSNFIT